MHDSLDAQSVTPMSEICPRTHETRDQRVTEIGVHPKLFVCSDGGTNLGRCTVGLRLPVQIKCWNFRNTNNKRQTSVFLEVCYKHITRDRDLSVLPYEYRAYWDLFATLYMIEARSLAVDISIEVKE